MKFFKEIKIKKFKIKEQKFRALLEGDITNLSDLQPDKYAIKRLFEEEIRRHITDYLDQNKMNELAAKALAEIDFENISKDILHKKIEDLLRRQF